MSVKPFAERLTGREARVTAAGPAPGTPRLPLAQRLGKGEESTPGPLYFSTRSYSALLRGASILADNPVPMQRISDIAMIAGCDMESPCGKLIHRAFLMMRTSAPTSERELGRKLLYDLVLLPFKVMDCFPRNGVLRLDAVPEDEELPL